MCTEPVYNTYDLSKEYLDSLPEIVRKVAKMLHSGKIKPEDLSPELVNALAKELRKGIETGFNLDSKKLEPSDPARDRISKIIQNIHLFSGFKTYKELKEASLLLRDAIGDIRPFNEFLKDVLAINNTYNINYLKAEYDHAVVCSQMMDKWQEFQYNKDIAPFLRFDATIDEHTTAICRKLDGIIRRVDDPFWKRYFLPLHWHERSDISQIRTGNETDLSKMNLPVPQPIFDNNVGVSGIIFPSKHPYFTENKKVRNEITNKVIKLLYEGWPKDQFSKVYDGKSSGSVSVHDHSSSREYNKNLAYGKQLADKGTKVMLLPHTDAHGVKNPDLLADGILSDFKEVLHDSNIRTSIINHIKSGSRQKVSNVVIFIPIESYNKDIVKSALTSSIVEGRNNSIGSVWINIIGNGLFKFSRKQIESGSLEELP